MSTPQFDHIVVVMMENHGFSEIIGRPEAPYINSLATGGALLNNYNAVAHPSEPNYFALYAGDTFGITDDNHYTEPGPTLNSILQAAGKTFTGYVESGGTSYDHNPWESFPEGFTVEKSFSAFPTADFSALPTVSFVIPNLNNDMHNGTVQQGDTWLQNNLDRYAVWAKANNSLLIVQWDESDSGSTNQVASIFSGAHVVPGVYGAAYNNYNILSTVLAASQLTGPRNAAAAVPVDVFGAATGGIVSGQVKLAAATERVPLDAATILASFSDTNAGDVAGNFTAGITWGDGTSSVGVVSGSNGSFSVSGGHTYADEGSLPLSVAFRRTTDSASLTVTGTVVTAEADVLTPHGATLAGTTNQALVNVTVATFTDTATAAPANDFSAAIDWGDGTTGVGTVSGSNGTFSVIGTHTYAAPGTERLTVVLTDDAPGTATATANSIAQIEAAVGVRTIGSAVAGPVVLTAADAPLTITSVGSVTSTDAGANAIESSATVDFAISNRGTIASSSASGISLSGKASIDNSYLISGDTAIVLNAGGTVANAAGGVIAGATVGIAINGPSATVANSGTISGSDYAVLFGDGGTDLLTVNPTAVFNGAVMGGSGANTLQLAGGSGSITELSGGAGTVTENGSWSFSNFQTIGVDAGGLWLLDGEVPTVVDNGIVEVRGSLTVSSAIDPGSVGTFQLDDASVIEVAAALGTGLRMSFLGSSELIVDDPSLFGIGVGTAAYAGPQLQNFGASGVIDLPSFDATGASVQFDASTGLLQIANSFSQNASLVFQTSTLGIGAFSVGSDGGGGTLLMRS